MNQSAMNAQFNFMCHKNTINKFYDFGVNCDIVLAPAEANAPVSKGGVNRLSFKNCDFGSITTCRLYCLRSRKSSLTRMLHLNKVSSVQLYCFLVLSISAVIWMVYNMDNLLGKDNLSEVQGEFQTEEDFDDNEFLNSVIDTFKSAIQFFDDCATEVNFDAVFCFQMARDQLHAFIDVINNSCSQKNQFIRKTQHILNQLQIRLNSTGKKLIQAAYRNDSPSEPYEDHDTFIEEGNWKFFMPSENIHVSYLYPPYLMNYTDINGTLMTSCFKELARRKNCNISTECWKYMTEPYKTGYYLTHQIIYILIAKVAGCETKVIKKSILHSEHYPDELMKILCTNALAESYHLDESDYILKRMRQDLLWEEMSFCGMFGYHEFFAKFRIESIINSQNKLGCFEPTIKSPEHHRPKRNEIVLDNGCFSHMTGLATLTLQQSIRFLLEPQLKLLCYKWPIEANTN